jgi:type VI secretion system protein ImpE
MSPRDLFDEGRLREATAAQAELLRRKPDDVGERLLLCDFLAFSAEREAVREHLRILANGPAEIREYVAEWEQLLAADQRRHAGGGPEFLTEPPEHVAARLEAWGCLATRPAKALDLIDDADESAPMPEGFVDGREFESWRDTDDLLGPVLELFADGRYYWLPVEQIRKMRLDEVEEIRDRLYRPATIQLIDSRRFEFFLPALYVNTATHAEDGIRCGAGIDWVEQAGLMRGLGARTFLFGAEELTLDEFRQVEVRPG